MAHDHILTWAGFIKGLGFRVFLASSGTYGFISDDKGERVLSFSFTDGGSLSGNYYPASHKSGTGWRMDGHPSRLKTAKDVREALHAYPPNYCGKGWKRFTTVADQLKEYGPSSKYEEI